MAKADASSAVKDAAISRVLEEVVKRPLFISITYSAYDDIYKSSILEAQSTSDSEIEIVGSSKDGLKTSKVFDVGDVDILMFSKITLDASDESTFEYRPGIQNFCHIPLPKKLSSLSTEGGKYLNAQFVRNFDSRLFGTKTEKNYRTVDYTILPKSVERSEMKCATTKATPYADPVFQKEFEAPGGYIDHKLYSGWQTEHVLLAYVLFKSNEEKLSFVRELLYGAEVHTNDDSKYITTKLKQVFGFTKQDFQKSVFAIHDQLYFRSRGFCSLLEQAIDKESPVAASIGPHGEYSTDLVPAIRCLSWPRAARSFIQRQRVWPSKEVIDDLVYSGFQIIPKASLVDPNPAKDFILSFSPAEAKLLRLLPEEAKKAYRIFKLCYKSSKSDMNTGHALKTYHLKTALLWVAENTAPESWATNGLLWGIRSIIEFLLDCLRNLHFPSFFVEDSNLIAHFSKEDAETQADSLKLIHRNPANFIKSVVDMEWQFTQATTSDDSFRKIQNPDYINSLTWLELIKVLSHFLAYDGDYQLDDILDQKGYLASEDLFSKYCQDPFNTTPPGNTPLILEASDTQLGYVEVFVQTVSQMGMDLFTVLEFEVDESIIHHSEEWIEQKTLELYPQFDAEADRQYGDYLLNLKRLRLKHYANIFHVICNQLTVATFQPFQLHTQYRNQDAAYIFRFLKALVSRKGFTFENVDDLLHYLLYFCHFTRLRHHNLRLPDQMLRSMREFLQDARLLMTVYFNPKLIFPVPVDIGDRAKTVLGECFQRNQTQGDNCSLM